MISYDKIKILQNMNKKVHVSCDGRFYNGMIVEVNEDKNFFILDDIKVGHIPIMFDEVLRIEPMEVRE